MPALCVESALHEPVSVSCVTAVPILKKMKVLKKFRRRMGLDRSETPQLPALLFNQVCGDNVRIECGGRVARRVESFCKGISFSNRSVKVGERIYVKLLEISTNWSGVIRFGFTSQDPSGLRDALPKYACPDLTSKPGYWAKALSERFADQGLVLFYYVTSAGDVHFGINGEEKGVFFTGVETRAPLWAVIDVYGNCTGVEFLDPLDQLNNRARIFNDLRQTSTQQQQQQHQQQLQSRVLPQPPSSPPLPPSSSNSPHSISTIQQRPLPMPTETVDALQPSMAQLALSHPQQASHHPAPPALAPFPFHHVKGRHVIFNPERSVAFRSEAEYSHGYVFTGRPLLAGERFVIRIQETEPVYVGALAFGLTAANPAGLEAADLPEDCDLLLDRPEYWVVSKDVASSPVPGDELTFGLSSHGQVTFSKNGGPTQTVMHVDHSLQLWAFFDVYGNTRKIRMLGSVCDGSPFHHTVSRRANSMESAGSMTPHPNADRPALTSPPSLPPPPVPSPHNHSSLVVNLPPSPPRMLPPGHDRTLPKRENSPGSGGLPSVGVGTFGGTYVEPVLSSLSSSPPSSVGLMSYGGMPIPTLALQGHHHECTVCYEKPVDSVLYMCGHMCMCYECALQQWRGRGGGHCPICRAPIRDVIRTYRS